MGEIKRRLKKSMYWIIDLLAQVSLFLLFLLTTNWLKKKAYNRRKKIKYESKPKDTDIDESKRIKRDIDNLRS